MEVVLAFIALAVLAIFVGGLGRHDANTPLGQEIRADQSKLQNGAQDAGNGILIFCGVLLLAVLAFIWISTGSL